MDDAPTLDENEKPTAEGAPPADPEGLLGETIAERYRVLECIGRGGMGVVYRARQTALDRDVVIKVLPERVLDDPRAVARFEREARGMSRLEHPHVVSTYDFGRRSDFAFICMEYVDGRDLGARLAEGAIPLAEFAPIAAQILDGVADAHEAGLVHRDLKPANIMLTERRGYPNFVKLLDFGLAKLVRGSRDDVTSDDTLIGSAAFLSPEQIMGRPIDERVDVYALGVLFYVMLSARKPFNAPSDVEVLNRHVKAKPPPLADRLPDDHAVPHALVELVHACLAKHPDNRPAGAVELQQRLERSAPPEATRLPWASGNSRRWSHRRSLTRTTEGTGETRTDETYAARTTDEGPAGESATGAPPDSRRDSTGETPRASASSEPTDYVERLHDDHPEDDTDGLRLGVVGAITAAILALGGLAVALADGWFAAPPESAEPTAPPPRHSKRHSPVEQPSAHQANSQPASQTERTGGDTADDAASGRASVETTPAGASVRIDGIRRGTSPWAGRLSEGHHQIEIRAPGYRTKELRRMVRGGDVARISVALQRKKVERPAEGSPPPPTDAPGRSNDETTNRAPTSANARKRRSGESSADEAIVDEARRGDGREAPTAPDSEPNEGNGETLTDPGSEPTEEDEKEPPAPGPESSEDTGSGDPRERETEGVPLLPASEDSNHRGESGGGLLPVGN